MKIKSFLTFLLCFFICFITACDNDDDEGNNLTAVLVSHSESCKTLVPEDLGFGSSFIEPDKDCVEFNYDGHKKLILNHINAAFNCCPGDLHAVIDISNNTISILEKENKSGCYCSCLYDLIYRLENLPAGTYTIRFMEPYIKEGDKPLEFKITIAPNAQNSGSFCVPRNHSPWRD